MERTEETKPEDASKEPKKRRSFSSKVEAAGEGMELGLRMLMGIMFVVFLSPFFYALGSYVWVGIGLLMAMGSAPFLFVLGFFWVEIKFMLKMAFRIITGIWFD